MTSELVVKIIPKSSQNAIIGYENNLLKIKIKAVPEKGKANEELLKFLSKSLKVPKTSIVIKSGLSGRQKRLEFQNISPKELDFRLRNLLK